MCLHAFANVCVLSELCISGYQVEATGLRFVCLHCLADAGCGRRASCSGDLGESLWLWAPATPKLPKTSGPGPPHGGYK